MSRKSRGLIALFVSSAAIGVFNSAAFGGVTLNNLGSNLPGYWPNASTAIASTIMQSPAITSALTSAAPAPP